MNGKRTNKGRVSSKKNGRVPGRRVSKTREEVRREKSFSMGRGLVKMQASLYTWLSEKGMITKL